VRCQGVQVSDRLRVALNEAAAALGLLAHQVRQGILEAEKRPGRPVDLIEAGAVTNPN
jgi:hypothetical protein